MILLTAEEQLSSILETLNDMREDGSVPKSMLGKFQFIEVTLKDQCDISMRVSKALAVLDELQENNNLQSFTRTQLFNVASMLEKIDV